jgi:hypothetical protein
MAISMMGFSPHSWIRLLRIVSEFFSIRLLRLLRIVSEFFSIIDKKVNVS